MLYLEICSLCFTKILICFSQGYIHRVEADEVYLRFADEFHANHRDGNLYQVQFTYNRVSVRRLYQATDAAAELDTGFLFPSESPEKKMD